MNGMEAGKVDKTILELRASLDVANQDIENLKQALRTKQEEYNELGGHNMALSKTIHVLRAALKEVL